MATSVQIKLNDYWQEKFEEKAKEKGFVHPSGKINLPGYFKQLGMEDLLNAISKIDDEHIAEYKVDKKQK